MFVTLSEEEVSFNEKKHLSLEEEGLLCQLLTTDKCTPKQKQLCEIANYMYGKKVKELKPKTGASFMTSGEAVVSAKAVPYISAVANGAFAFFCFSDGF